MSDFVLVLSSTCLQEPGEIRPFFKLNLRKSGLRKFMNVSISSCLPFSRVGLGRCIESRRLL